MSSSANTAYKRPLWFEPFLQQLKVEFGYPLDIRKYGQLLTWANNNKWSSADGPLQKLYDVCRVLFLQNPEHENRFQEIFKDYLVDELAFEQGEMQLLNKQEDKSKTTEREVKAEEKKVSTDQSKKINEEQTLEAEPPDDSMAATVTTTKKYLNFTIPVSTEDASPKSNSPGSSRFLLSDAYLPLTGREMIHGWRHLRKRERFRLSDRLDVKATVQHIAQQGILLQPVFEKEHINSDDLLVIFADRRGSMTAFHKLTDKLIETAIKGGGHRNAMVYYFSNCPVEFVYKNATLTEPVPLTQLYSQMRPDHTNALIISDAGAARGNTNEYRIKKTFEFLYGNTTSGTPVDGLHKRALFVAWLNPMPPHRWINSSAASIANDPDTPMYSLMENGYNNFLHLIEKLMGK